MNLRRERTHQMGASNLVYQPGPSTPNDKKTSRISFTSLKKGKKATDVIDNKRVSRGLLSPITTTQEMYKSAGKLMHSKTLVGYPRLAQLEEVEKRKMVFTGESFLIYDKVLEKYRDLDMEIESQVQQSPTKETLAKEKHNIYGTAAQETQLVGYDKHSADTLKNNVNLEKVREARRVLRRRYASRKNMYSIYNAWDEDNKGVVDLDDVFNMSKKLGLNLNVDEARVLLASANKSGTGALALDEFLDLIYNKDDVLNVDLDNLASNLGSDYLVKREELENGDDNLLRKLEEDAKKTREIKHMNQTNLILKNHLHEINMNFLEADPNHAGYVNSEKFEEVLKKLGISETVVSGNDIKNLFEKHKSDGHTINYKDFIKMLKDFVFQYEDAYKEQKPQIRRAQSINYANEKTDENEFHIVDCRTLPYHSIIDYWTRTKKVNRAIKRFFPNKKDFYAYLGGALHVDKEQVAERYVSGKELKNLVDGLFHNFDDGEVEKRDFEGFLSSCVYNIQGDTNLGEVAKLVYEEEEREFFNKIIFKRKGPGPRKEDAENDINSDTRTLVELPAITNSTWTKEPGLDKLLQKIDNVFFVGTKKAYEAFKAFDSDKDGYISRKDLAKKLQDMAIMTPEEGQRVLDYVDPENKGYVNFHEFSSKIRPNMVQQDEKGEYTVLPFVTSSKEAIQRAAQTIPHTTEKVKKMKAAVQPDNVEQRAKTRYNANPCWTNTFLTFQASSKSPMFVTESERFDRDPQARVKFQHEAFNKKKEFEDGRLKNKQKFAAFFNDRVEQETNALDRLDENRRTKKYMLQARYEQRAKLFNSYV